MVMSSLNGYNNRLHGDYFSAALQFQPGVIIKLDLKIVDSEPREYLSVAIDDLSTHVA